MAAETLSLAPEDAAVSNNRTELDSPGPWVPDTIPETREVGPVFYEELSRRFHYEPKPSDVYHTQFYIAEWIARDNSFIVFPTRYTSIVNSLGSNRAAELLDCMGRRSYGLRNERGSSEVPGSDYLSMPITQRSIVWEPMGRWQAEQFLVYDFHDSSLAFSKFVDPLQRDHLVNQKMFAYPWIRPEFGKSINPEGKPFTEEQWEVLAFAYGEHDEAVHHLIYDNGLFEAQLAARKDAVARRRYETVPGIAYGTLEHCDQRPKETIALNIMYVLEGWAVHLVILHGEYPELDQKQAELRAAIELRDLELANYVASF